MAEMGSALPELGEVYAAEAQQGQGCPEWKVSGIFSSQMVLQHGRPITVHGWCAHPGAVVEGEWDGQAARGKVLADGSWALTFPPHAPSFEPTVMTLRSEYGADVFDDVLVGDVWLIGGQSNADLPLSPCLAETPEIDRTISGEHPFRLFRQTQVDAAEYALHHNTPAEDIIKPEWRWQRPDREAALPFSALGYYFARLAAPKVDLPLGLVMAAAGGACLRELMPEGLAKELGYTSGANVPLAGYYNALLAPLVGMQFRGQIFFQGESEGCWRETSLCYARDLEAYVADERRRFGFDFPFYNVQLSSYRQEGAEFFKYALWVRPQQLDARELIADSYLAVDRDLGSRPGDPDWAHSPLKYALAERVAAQVLANEYGIGDPEAAEAPSPAGWEDTDGGVLVRFAHTNGGLKTADGGAVKGFALVYEDADGVPGEPADAEIVRPDAVLVRTKDDRRPARVQYAVLPIAGIAEANLVGGTGLPAFSAEMRRA